MFFNMFLKHNNKPLCIPLKHAEVFLFQLADVCLQVPMLDCYCARQQAEKTQKRKEIISHFFQHLWRGILLCANQRERWNHQSSIQSSESAWIATLSLLSHFFFTLLCFRYVVSFSLSSSSFLSPSLSVSPFCQFCSICLCVWHVTDSLS